jgi:hypothetical protein
MKSQTSTFLVKHKKAIKINIDGHDYWECTLDDQIARVKLSTDNEHQVRVAPNVEVNTRSGEITEYLVPDYNS